VAARAVQTVLFPDLFAKPLVAAFDTPEVSSGGGAIKQNGPTAEPLQKLLRRMGVVRCNCLPPLHKPASLAGNLPGRRA
jgi:hypothetical protein